MDKKNKLNHRKLKVAIVGCGVVARKHLKAINYYNQRRKITEFSFELIALIDPRQEVSQKLRDSYQGKSPVSLFSDLTELFKASSDGNLQKPDILAITTPSGLHYQQALEALQNHCHVLVEKPITMAVEEANHLLEIALSQQLKIAVGHIYRYFPIISMLRQDLKNGKFGKPLFGNVRIFWGHDQAYYDSAAWRGSRKMDGGAIMNQSIHGLDLMHWLLGNPELLSAKGSISRQAHEMESEDLGFGIFEFENNIWLSLTGTTNTDPARKEADFFVRYSEGDIHASLINGKIHFSGRSKAGHELKNKYFWRFFKDLIRRYGLAYLSQISNPHTAIYFDLANAILYDKIPLADGESGKNALKLVTALYQDAGVFKTSEIADSPD